jgi:hypothetical protein
MRLKRSHVTPTPPLRAGRKRNNRDPWNQHGLTILYRTLLYTLITRRSISSMVPSSRQSKRPRQIPIRTELENLPMPMDLLMEAEVVSVRPESTVLLRILMLLRPGDGQQHGDRCAQHDGSKKRSAFDPQIWTHLFLLVASIAAAHNEVYDMCTLLSLTTFLSTLYHFDFEKPGLVAKIEGLLAKATFLYGIVQLCYAPTTVLLLSEILFLSATLGVFVSTNVCKQYYDPWHCLMHVVPAGWAFLIVFYHEPLISL